MNDELEKKLVEYMAGLESRLKTAEDFAVEQLPDVIQQWLAWELWSSVTLAALFLLVAACIGIFVKKFWKFAGDFDSVDRAFARGIVSILGTIVMAGFLVAAGSNVYWAVKVSVAPKIVILEKVSQLAGFSRSRR